MRNLLAVDPSLTCSGWALFSLEDGELLGVGKIRSLGTDHSLSERYRDLQEKIEALFVTLGIGDVDALICEGETTMRDPRAAFRVEQVRGIFETLARGRGCLVPGRINPRTVHNEVMGLRGKQLKREIVKETAVGIVRNLFRAPLERIGFDCGEVNLRRHQDIVDATLVGYLGMTRIRTAKSTGVSVTELFAQKRRAA